MQYPFLTLEGTFFLPSCGLFDDLDVFIATGLDNTLSVSTCNFLLWSYKINYMHL